MQCEAQNCQHDSWLSPSHGHFISASQFPTNAHFDRVMT